MDPPQLGESSRSPQRQTSSRQENADSRRNGHAEDVEDRMRRLILGSWPEYASKHVHPSHDLISLLHLDGLYNTYVRPFADNIGPDEDGNVDDAGVQIGQKRKRNKRAKMDKGYLHLIDDCIDPTPMGEKKDNMSIVPLIPDLLPIGQGQPPPDFGDRPQMLSMDLFRNARLEAGQTVDGYEPGNKLGVEAEEEKRRKKKANRAQALQPTSATIASPALPPYATPGTPGPAINPPRPPFTINARKGSLPYRPGPPGTPGTPYGPSLGTPARPPGTPYAPGLGTPVRPPIGTPRAGLPMRPMMHGTPGTPRAGLPVRPTAGYAPGTPRLGGPMRPSGTPGHAQTPGTPRFPSGMAGKRPGEPLPHLNIKRSKAGGTSRSASPAPRPNSAGMPGQQQNQQGRPGMGKQARGGTAGM